MDPYDSLANHSSLIDKLQASKKLYLDKMYNVWEVTLLSSEVLMYAHMHTCTHIDLTRHAHVHSHIHRLKGSQKQLLPTCRQTCLVF